MQLIAELCAEHRLLEAQAAQLIEIVAAPVADPAAVAAVRWRMAQAVSDHCAREDRGIYDRLLASGDALATAVAWHYRREHGALGETFGRYVAEWPVDRIAREWPQFRFETESLVETLAERVSHEEQVLYHHAKRVTEARRAAEPIGG